MTVDAYLEALASTPDVRRQGSDGGRITTESVDEWHRLENARLHAIWDRCASGDGAQLPVHKGEPKGLAVMLFPVSHDPGFALIDPFEAAQRHAKRIRDLRAAQETTEESLARARRDAEAYVSRGGR